MREYFTVLFFVCLLSGTVSVLAPSDSVKKYIEYIGALCVIGAMIIPIFQVIPSKNDILDIFAGYESEAQNYDEIYNNFWNAEDERALTQALTERLADELGLPDEYFCIELCVSQTENSGRVLEGVRLSLTDVRALSANPEIIRGFFLDTAGVECEIVYNFSDE